MKAALAGDRKQATAVALAFMAGTRGSRVSVMTDLFDVAQGHIADRWHVGDATVEDEYRVFEAITAAMAALPVPMQTRRSPDTTSTALLITLSAEEHDLGLRFVAAALGDDGWNVELAQQIEPAELAERVRDRAVNLVGVSSTYDSGAARQQLSSAIRAAHSSGLPVLVGGASFVRAPLLAGAIGADATAEDARLAVILARRLRATKWQRRASRASFY